MPFRRQWLSYLRGKKEKLQGLQPQLLLLLLLLKSNFFFCGDKPKQACIKQDRKAKITCSFSFWYWLVFSARAPGLTNLPSIQMASLIAVPVCSLFLIFEDKCCFLTLLSELLMWIQILIFWMRIRNIHLCLILNNKALTISCHCCPPLPSRISIQKDTSQTLNKSFS